MSKIVLDDINNSSTGERALVLTTLKGAKTTQQIHTEVLAEVAEKYEGWNPTIYGLTNTIGACESAFSVLVRHALSAYLFTTTYREGTNGETITVVTITPP